MSPRGRARKHDPTIPGHIDQAALPEGVYWQRSGNGRWRARVLKEGRWTLETVAGPTARLSDLHRIMELDRGGPAHGSVAWMLAKFHASTVLADLAQATRRDYDVCRAIVEVAPTRIGVKFGALVADKLTPTNVQAMHERIVKEGHPSKANHVLRYLRRVYSWAVPHLGMKANPAKSVQSAKERQRRRLPSTEVYDQVVGFARSRGALQPHSKGSVPPYLWIVAELGYLCRLRGIETNTLTEAHGTPEGLHTNRRKGSRDNLVEWSPRLREAWDAALVNRKRVVERTTNIQQLRAEDRFLFLSEDGEPLTKDGLDSAWQRLIAKAVKDGVIAEADRFSLHDLKRKGGTDTKGNRADKQDALGHRSESMMAVYDLSVPRVLPSDAT